MPTIDERRATGRLRHEVLDVVVLHREPCEEEKGEAQEGGELRSTPFAVLMCMHQHMKRDARCAHVSGDRVNTEAFDQADKRASALTA